MFAKCGVVGLVACVELVCLDWLPFWKGCVWTVRSELLVNIDLLVLLDSSFFVCWGSTLVT